MSAASAFALEGDRIRPNVGLTYTRTNNTFYLDDRESGGGALLERGKRGDDVLGLRAGLDVDHYISRQTLKLRSEITDNRHRTYDNLDYVSYDAQGTWGWVAGDSLDGEIGAEKNQIASNLYDFRSSERRTRNLRTRDEYFGNVQLKLSPDWRLRAGLRYTDVGNSIDRFRTLDREEWSAEFGSRYRSKGPDDYLGLTFRYTDGRMPNREVTGSSTVDNAFSQYRLEGEVNYQLSGLTRLVGNLGYTRREHKEVPERDFSGFTGRLAVTYGLSAKTSVNGTVFREIGAWGDVNASFILTQGISFGVTQAITEKVDLQGNASLRSRSFEGDPGFRTGLPQKRDRFTALSFAVVWTPTRLSKVTTSLSYDTRKANAAWESFTGSPFNDFDVLTLSVSGQITF